MKSDLKPIKTYQCNTIGMEVHFSTVDSEGQSHGLSVGQSDMKSEGQSDVKFSATLAWIDVALDKPVVFRLDKNVFRIASSAGDYY